MTEINIFGTVTDMKGTSVERKKYYIDLQDGEKKIQFVLVVTEADGGLVAEPYVPAQDYGYDQYDEDLEDEDEGFIAEEEEEDEEAEVFDDTPQPNNFLPGNPYRSTDVNYAGDADRAEFQRMMDDEPRWLANPKHYADFGQIWPDDSDGLNTFYSGIDR